MEAPVHGAHERGAEVGLGRSPSPKRAGTAGNGRSVTRKPNSLARSRTAATRRCAFDGMADISGPITTAKPSAIKT